MFVTSEILPNKWLQKQLRVVEENLIVIYRWDDLRMNVLIMDDNEVMRRELSEWLSRQGHHVRAQGPNETAMDLIKGEDYNLIITDLRVSGISGMEVIKEVNKVKPNTHTVIVTAYGTIETAVEAMKLGVSDYLCKPFEIVELKSVLDDVEISIQLEENAESEESGNFPKSVDIYEHFNAMIKEDKGLWITSENPDLIKKRCNLKNVTVLWLTSDLKDDTCLDPKNLYDLKLHIEYFLRDNPRGTVLFEGLEILIEEHSWDIMKKFIFNLLLDIINEPLRLIISIKSDEIENRVLTELKSMLTAPHIQIISESLSGPIRRNCLRFLSLNGGSSFTCILKELNISDAPKLSFHLRKLVNDGILQKDRMRIYSLTQLGKKTVDLLEALECEVINKSNNGIKLIMNPIAM